MQKFNKLPKDLRDKVSSPAVMAAINDLEKEYGITLASVVMKVMAKEITIAGLNKYFLEEENFDAAKTVKIIEALKSKVFKDVVDYLGIETTEDYPKILATEKPAVVKQDEAPAVEGANFFFSSEDEEEIRELTRKIGESAKGKIVGDGIEGKLDSIMSLAQINFGSQELQDRFRSILRVYLRGVRDRIETKQTLKKPFAGGGLGFDSDSVDKVMEITDGVKGGEDISGKAPLKIRLPEDEIAKKTGDKNVSDLKNIGVRDVDYDFSSAIAKKSEKKIGFSEEISTMKPAEKLDISHELAPPPPSIFSPASQSKNQPLKKIEVEKPKTKPAVKKPSMMPMERFEIKRSAGGKMSFRRPSEATGKKKMEDVKYVPPKIMSSIDELRYMDLVNFRRLAPDPLKQVMKIKEKINLLEEEKYSKRAEAISAWRQSPINRLYLAIGQKSISENKPIDVIIEEKKNSGEDYLTLDELKSIMDLNKELRF
ncbi:MAG: hypothetical protein WC582_00450 [Patescibacteria group bacterium]